MLDSPLASLHHQTCSVVKIFPGHDSRVLFPSFFAVFFVLSGLIVKIKVIVLPETGFFVRLDPESMIPVLVREGVPEAGLRFLKDQVFLRVKGPVGHLHFLCPGIFLLRPVPENAPEPEVILVDPASFISCRLPGPEGRKLLVFGGEVQIVEKDPALFAEGFYSRKIQGSQGEPLRRVRVAWKATSSFPHACASYNSAGDIPLCYTIPTAF